MKTTTESLFSNGSECESWMQYNCERCLKHSGYNWCKDSFSAFRCSIDKAIQLQAAGFNEISLKAYEKAKEAIESDVCPHIQLTRKTVTKKRKIKNQLDLGL